MKKRIVWTVWLALLPFALTGCTATTISPLEKAEATAVPGLNMELHAASANESNTDTFTATLYFRYGDEPMLGGESRVLTVSRDESTELAIVRALLEGPGAGHSELTRLLPEAAYVESVSSRDDLLYITFDEGFLRDEIPEGWANDDAWRAEAPLRRRLAVQSLVASVTESFAYTGVQVLVHRANAVQTSLRLDNSYFLDGRNGPSDPLTRDEGLLLTPQHVMERTAALWQMRDYQRLYLYLAEAGKPGYEQAVLAWDACPSLTRMLVSSGSVSANGQSAVLSLDLTTLHEGAEQLTTAYPFRLTRENDLWKLDYDRLLALMQR